jgi:hypothetical protein
MTVDAFLTFIATPFILIVTGIFVYVARHASRLTEAHEQHERKEAGRFAYTEASVDEVRTGIDQIHGKLNDNLLPQINEMYSLMARPAAHLKGSHLENLIADGGFKPAKVMEDPEAYFVGVECDEIKVSVLVRYVQEVNKLVFQSFAAVLKSKPPALQEALLTLNQELIMGTIGIRDVGKHHVLFVNYSVADANRCVSPNMVKGIVETLGHIHVRVVAILKEHEVYDRVLLANEFMQLENEKAQKLIDARKAEGNETSQQGNRR